MCGASQAVVQCLATTSTIGQAICHRGVVGARISISEQSSSADHQCLAGNQTTYGSYRDQGIQSAVILTVLNGCPRYTQRLGCDCAAHTAAVTSDIQTCCAEEIVRGIGTGKLDTADRVRDVLAGIGLGKLACATQSDSITRDQITA